MLESIKRRQFNCNIVGLALAPLFPFKLNSIVKQEKIIPCDYVIVPEYKDLSKLSIIEKAGICLIHGFKVKFEEEKIPLEYLRTMEVYEDATLHRYARIGWYSFKTFNPKVFEIVYEHEDGEQEHCSTISNAIDFPLELFGELKKTYYNYDDYNKKNREYALELTNMFKNYEKYIGYSQEEIDKIVESFA